MSFTQWFTRSSPTVPWRPVRKASFSLVPTPSVLATRTGCRAPRGTRYSPPNEPSSLSVSGVAVERTSSATPTIARCAASMSTPAAAYESPPAARSDTGVHRQLEHGHLAERAHALLDLVHRQVLEALHREALHRVRAQHRAVDDGAAQVVVVHAAALRQVSHEPAREGVAGAGGVEHLFQREAGSEEGGVRGE